MISLHAYLAQGVGQGHFLCMRHVTMYQAYGPAQHTVDFLDQSCDPAGMTLKGKKQAPRRRQELMCLVW